MLDTFIPKAYLEQLLIQASAADCDVEAILAKADLSTAALADINDIPARKYGEIYRLVMRATRNEWFGMFSGGERVPLGAFRMMALTILQCKNLRQAIFRASDFADICRGMNACFFLHELDHGICVEGEYQSQVRLSSIRSIPEARFQRMLDNAQPDTIVTSLLMWHRFMEWLIDREIPLNVTTFRFSTESLTMPLVHASLRNTQFDQTDNTLQFDSRFLDYPIVQNQDTLDAFLRSAPYHLVTQDQAHTSPADKVRNILNRDVSGTMPTAEQVAEKLNVSVTTLRRQLQRESTSYQRLKDACRMEAAFHYLNCAELSSNEIAEKLGFDESSAFFRSFKKWTGMTPGEYRNNVS